MGLSATNDEYAKRVGDVIARLCGLFLLSQAELSEATNVSPHTLSAIVRGKVEARRRTYAKIFDWFELPISDDFGELLPEVVERFRELDDKARALKEKH